MQNVNILSDSLSISVTDRGHLTQNKADLTASRCRLIMHALALSPPCPPRIAERGGIYGEWPRWDAV